MDEDRNKSGFETLDAANFFCWITVNMSSFLFFTHFAGFSGLQRESGAPQEPWGTRPCSQLQLRRRWWVGDTFEAWVCQSTFSFQLFVHFKLQSVHTEFVCSAIMCVCVCEMHSNLTSLITAVSKSNTQWAQNFNRALSRKSRPTWIFSSKYNIIPFYMDPKEFCFRVNIDEASLCIK